jgi:hypothetical protein
MRRPMAGEVLQQRSDTLQVEWRVSRMAPLAVAGDRACLQLAATVI